MSVSTPAGFERVAIVGLGLMGGSLARALSGLPVPPRVLGWSPDPGERARALDAGAVTDAPPHVDDVVTAADLVVYALPLGALLDLLPSHAERWAPGAIATDVCSLKVPVLRAVGAGAAFIGGHPMAGATEGGFGASRPDLYRGARVWLVPGAEAPAGTLERVAGLWRALGADPHTTSAAEHDALMARVSHLPQAAASALALALAELGVDPADLGPGGRDSTRLAASPAALWSELLLAAREEDLRALRALGDALSALEDALRSGDGAALGALLERAAGWKARPGGEETP